MKRLLVSGLLLLTTSIISCAEPVLGVCDILADLDKFSGKIVTIHGRLAPSSDVWLVPTSNCDKEIRVGSLSFQNLVAIRWPSSVIVRAQGIAVPFSEDTSSLRAFNAIVQLESAVHSDIYFTFEAYIWTRNPPLALVHPNSPNTPIGFGHLGSAPAAIVVKRLVKVEFFLKSVLIPEP